MNSHRIRLTVVLFLLALPAMAQPVRTFVSAATGDDLNPCSLTSPCRNLWRGVQAVATNGEVVPLDSGGYGTLTISKSVIIAVPSGVYAGITATVPGVSGVTFDTPSVAVTLRGVSINGLGGPHGVSAPVAGISLNVERSAISRFPGAAINFSSNGGRLFVKDSFIRDTELGIKISSSDPGNVVRAMIEHVRLNGNGGLNNGAVSARANSMVTVNDSVASGNFRGFEVVSSGSFASMTVENSASTGNAVGLLTSGGGGDLVLAMMRVSDSLIAHNTLFGIEVQGGSAITSRGNNTVVDNAAAETFSGPFFAK